MSATIKLSSPATREFWEIPVLFEDEHLIALDKPAGLLTTPELEAPELATTPEVERPNLIKLLHAGIAAGKPWAQERKLTYLHHEHRLDTDASGVLLLTKNKAAHIAIADFFGSDQRLLKYVALVRGTPDQDSFEVNARLAPHPAQPGRVAVDDRNGKAAKTHFTLLENFPIAGISLLRCEPVPDRQHQLRVHLNRLHWPVVADELYGGKPLWLSRLKKDFRLKPGHEERPLLARAALHLEELTVVHPATRETLTIKSEWPKDLRVAVKYLRLYAVAG